MASRVSAAKLAARASRRSNFAAARVVKKSAAAPRRRTPSLAPPPAAPATPSRRRAKAGANREVPCSACVKATLKGDLPNYGCAGPIGPTITVAFAAFLEEKRGASRTRAAVREALTTPAAAAPAPAVALAPAPRLILSLV
ncbi:hypothetical protein DL95DRAFT_472511 [Leptodontidium sp. 2 PMI_412]|nr:hypothetical protein DL95DRAFT_472511 [Leptodontidium sp. 2 PMI_412]